MLWEPSRANDLLGKREREEQERDHQAEAMGEDPGICSPFEEMCTAVRRSQSVPFLRRVLVALIRFSEELMACKILRSIAL